jgi:hypothetical protein
LGDETRSWHMQNVMTEIEDTRNGGMQLCCRRKGEKVTMGWHAVKLKTLVMEGCNYAAEVRAYLVPEKF